MISPRQVLCAAAFSLWGAFFPLQETPHFYNVDTERQVEGIVQKLIFEPRYEGGAPFLIIILEENKTGQVYTVEISPVWFFDHDLHKGEKIKVTGSVYTKDGALFLIARQLQVGGEIFVVRDSRGFPSWRGGPAKMKTKRRGRGM